MIFYKNEYVILKSVLFLHLIVTLKFENTLNDLNLSSGWFKSTECSPIVYDQTCTNNVRSSVNCTSAKWYLQQIRKFIKLLDCSLRMDETSVVANHTICSD